MIISRYLTKEVLNTLLAVVLILILAFLSQQIVRYLNYVAVGKIPTSVLVRLVAFEVPYLLALLLPLGLYLGIMLTYGRLYADNEMVILKQCGFNNRRIIRLTMIIALVVASVVWGLMLWVNPNISLKRQNIMEGDETTTHLIQTLMPGRFQVSPDGRHVMFVEKLSRDHERAEKVFVAEKRRRTSEDMPTSWMTVFADQGYQIKDKETGEPYFVTTNGYRYEGEPGRNDYKIIQFKKYAVRMKQNDMRSRHEQTEALSTIELWNRYDEPKNAAELQWRLSVGLSAFLLAMLAVPLSTVRPRGGRYVMLIPAIIVYVLYIHFLIIARHWVEQNSLPLGWGMWWVHSVIVMIIGMMFLTQSRIRGGV